MVFFAQRKDESLVDCTTSAMTLLKCEDRKQYSGGWAVALADKISAKKKESREHFDATQPPIKPYT